MCQLFVNSTVDVQLCHLGERVLIKQGAALNKYLFKGADHL